MSQVPSRKEVSTPHSETVEKQPKNMSRQELYDSVRKEVRDSEDWSHLPFGESELCARLMPEGVSFPHGPFYLLRLNENSHGDYVISAEISERLGPGDQVYSKVKKEEDDAFEAIRDSLEEFPQEYRWRSSAYDRL